MSDRPIEVRVHGRGTVVGSAPSVNEKTEARCSLCGTATDAVAAVSGDSFACKSCLRERLESITVALYLFKDARDAKGLPWGKISG